MTRASKLALAAFGFSIAAALSSWNPLAAPFGLVVGLAALVLSMRALQEPGGRRVAVAALAISALAMVASGVVLSLTAGVGREPTGAPMVEGPTRDEASGVLDQAEERTRAARANARDELGKVGGEASPPERKGAKPAR
jgi:hypothetical protein